MIPASLRARSRAGALLVAVALTAIACSEGSSSDGLSPSPSPSRSTDPHALELRGRATAFETTGRVQGFGTLRLEGTFLLAATVTVVVSGASKRLLVDGGTATIRGSGLGVLGRVSTITTAGMDATGDAIPASSKRRSADRPAALPRVFLGGDFEIEGPHVFLDNTPVRGTETLHAMSGSAVLYGTAHVRSLPATIDVVQDETGRAPRAPVATPTFFSWRGPASAEVNGKRFTGKNVTVIASTISARVSRSGSGFDVEGAGRATQVAVDGKPKLETTLQVKVTPPGGKYYPGRSDQLTWVQVNAGPWEAIVTEVRALNVAAHWVRLYVDAPPPLDGPGGASLLDASVRCTRKAAIFAEFSLCAQIAPGHGDQEEVIFKVPGLQPLGQYEGRFEILGNFPTVRVTLPMKVVAR